MSDRYFVDTNILVYAHDRDSGRRHELSKALVKELWEQRSGVLSTQVLQELYVNLRRKAARPLDVATARQLVEDYLSWKVVVNDGAAVLRAIDLEERYSLSFWDALIIDAAHNAGATMVYSEDLGHGQRYGGIEVRNPFA
ncbi:MAG TPA: PIN domain-containing protein [Chondromyces sp.]|nr:PIN domain-containing protein [Chondromyces sp.]